MSKEQNGKISEKKRYEFYSLMQLCFLKKYYSMTASSDEKSVFSKQCPIREIFEPGLNDFYDVPKFKGKNAKKKDFEYIAYLPDQSEQVKEDKDIIWHYEHIVPINTFLKYFEENCGNLSFESFENIINKYAVICGVTESVNKKLNELYSNKMPDDRDFKDNNFFVWDRYKKISEEFEKDGKQLIIKKKKDEDDFEEISFDELKKSVRN